MDKMNAMEKGITALFYTGFEILQRKDDKKERRQQIRTLERVLGMNMFDRYCVLGVFFVFCLKKC